MMNYTIVTSINKQYWEQGSSTNISSWDKNFPKNVTIHIYSEDGILGNFSDRVIWHDLYTDVKPLTEFINRHKDDPHYNGSKATSETQRYKWNAIKFAHKTFALFDAKKYATDALIWLDADVLCISAIDQLFLKNICPKEYAVSYLGRPTTHSECGFVFYNLTIDFGKQFLIHFENFYKEDNLSKLEQTHDSFVFDAVRKIFDQSVFYNLNKDALNNKHPFHESALHTCLVHNKGYNKEYKQQKFIKRHNLDI